MKKLGILLAVAVVLLLLIAGIWLLLARSFSNDGGRLREAPKTGEAKARESSSPRRGSRGALPAATSTSAEIPIATAPSLVDDYLEQPKDGVVVRVLDEKSREPVPGIDVYLQREGGSSFVGEALGLSYLNQLNYRGPRFRADERGELRVPASELGATLVAVSENRWGSCQHSPPDESREILVQELKQVQVRVVDETGQPLSGASVAWSLEWTGNGRVGRPQAIEATLAPEGTASLLLMRGGAGDQSKFWVSLVGSWTEPIRAEIDLENLPGEPITLIAPTRGSLSIAIVNADGSPAQGDFFVELRPQPDENAKTRSPSMDVEATFVASGGSGRSDWLGLGQRFQVKVRPIGVSVNGDVEREILGPAEPGEVVALKVELDDVPRRCVVRGRLIDENYLPLRDCQFRLRSIVNDKVQWGAGMQRHRSDQEGRFALVVDAPPLRPGDSRQLEFRMTDPMGFDRLFLASSSDFLPGEHDLGDIMPVADPLIARGRVIDPSGAPVPLAEVWVFKPGGSPDSPAPAPDRDRGLLLFGKCDQEGRFEFRARLAETDLMLRGSNGFMTTDAYSVRGVASSVDLQLKPLGRLRAHVIVEGRGPVDCLTAYFVPDGDLPGDGIELSQSGRIDQTLDPGRYRLKFVATELGPDPQFTAGPFELGQGQTLDLGEIRVPFAVTRVRLTIDTGAERPFFVAGELRIEEPGTGEVLIKAVNTIFDESLQFLVLSLPVDVELTLDGFRPGRVHVKNEVAKIRLERGLDVTLQIDGTSGLDSDVFASIKLVTKGQDGRQYITDPQISQVPWAAFELKLSRVGRYEAEMTVSLVHSELDLVPIFSTPLGAIDVRDQKATQTFHLSIDRAALDARIAEARAGK